jgi:hypothetical protein
MKSRPEMTVDIIELIIKDCLQDSFDELVIHHHDPEEIRSTEPVLVIDGTKGSNTYSFKYTFQDLSSLYEGGTLSREMTRAKNRALKESF